ncbi:WhiB family transcriptional regulator [Streptomyces cinereoruber]|uniref:WhiB family transcriptional regulator n=1 Tax=Streptomyces cinereoruber TaxID=67260 RepID=UPI0036657A93
MHLHKDWRQHSLCASAPDLFFPSGSGGHTKRQVTEAKAICGRCSVLSSCRIWVLKFAPQHGIWAGMTPPERRMLSQANASRGR